MQLQLLHTLLLGAALAAPFPFPGKCQDKRCLEQSISRRLEIPEIPDVPSIPDEPVIVPGPQVEPGPKPVTEPNSAPGLEPAPDPESLPGPGPEPGPGPGPGPAPEPAPAPAPEPAPAPAPEPAPAPAPAPKPASGPNPAPNSQPASDPKPESDPKPDPDPEPEPIPNSPKPITTPETDPATEGAVPDNDPSICKRSALGRRCPTGEGDGVLDDDDDDLFVSDAESLTTGEAFNPDTIRTELLTGGHNLRTRLDNRLNDFKAKIQQNPNVKLDQKGGIEWEEGYVMREPVTDQSYARGAGGLQNTEMMIKDLGLPTDLKFTRQEVLAKTKDSKETPLVQEDWFSQPVKGREGNNNILVSIFTAMKRQDKAGNVFDIGLPGQTKFWNQLFKDAADKAMGDEYLLSSGWLFRDNIINEITLTGMSQVRNDLLAAGKITEATKFITLDVSSSDQVISEAVDIILGTRNAKGLPHLLMDFPDAMGRKRISKIHIWSHDQYDIGSIAFELAPL